MCCFSNTMEIGMEMEMESQCKQAKMQTFNFKYKPRFSNEKQSIWFGYFSRSNFMQQFLRNECISLA